MAKQTKITKSARGEQCTVRISGICNHDSETTVFAHLGGAGMGVKSSNAHGAYCCSSCHDAVDGRVRTKYTTEQLNLWLLEAVIRTQIILFEKGLLKIWT